MNRLMMKAMLLVVCAGTFAGCTIRNHRTSLQHQPVAKKAGRSGVVYLTMNGNRWNEIQDMRSSPHRGKYSPEKTPRKRTVVPRKINVVKVKNDGGITTGKYVMPVSSGDLILGGLKRELTTAGYKVIVVRKLPKYAEKGFDISWVSTDMQQKSGLLTLEGKCDLRIRLDKWRNGLKHESRQYASTVYGYSIVDQDLLLHELLTKATQNIAAKAVPDIINPT